MDFIKKMLDSLSEEDKKTLKELEEKVRTMPDLIRSGGLFEDTNALTDEVYDVAGGR